MRKLVSLFVVLIAALALAVPASAVQFGSPDGNAHPQVGLAAFFSPSRGFWRCSGTLISPTRFLTAGHCTAGAMFSWVFFDEVVNRNPWEGIPGVPVTKPGFDGFASFPASHDLGMIVLSAPQAPPYASMAPAGTLDRLKNGRHTTFDIVGYGIQDALPPHFLIQRARYAGQAMLANTQSAFAAGYNVRLTAAPGTGGALCDGDSGGPVFLEGTTTIVAVVSLKTTDHCMGGTLVYRTDTADSLGFITP